MTKADLQNFAKAKKEAEALYFSVEKLRCPALQEDIYFSSDGFHHLQFDGTRSERTKTVQKNKMLCLKEAIDILRKTTTIQEYRTSIQPVGKSDSKGYRQTKEVYYYAFHAITDFRRIRRINIVVKKIGNGHYHFWSVMPSWKEEKVNDTQVVRRIGGGWIVDG